MSFDRIQNTTSQQLEPVVLPAAAGGMLSGVVYNTAGLVVAYRTELTSTWTTVTLVAGTVGTWVSSSWVQDTTGPLSGGAGLYQLCLPSAAYNQAGATRLFIMVALSTIQNGYVLIERDLGAANPQDGQRLGLTALPASGTAATPGEQMDLVNAPNTTAIAAIKTDLGTIPASVAGSVGSVVGNVGGNVAGSVASVTAGVNVTQIAGQTASAAAGVTFPATIAAPGNQMDLVNAPNTTALTAIAMSVWNTLTSAAFAVSSMAKWVLGIAPLTSTQTQAAAAAAITSAEPIAATVAGTGNAALTVTVTNSVTTGKVSGATVTLINSAGGVQSNGITNSSGVTVPALGAPAGVYTLATTASGYLGASQTVTLDPGANPAAVALAPIAVPSPLSGQVTGTCYTRDGSGAIIGNKQVSFTITTLPSGQTGNALSYQPVSATSDNSGLLAVSLWASSTYNANGGGPNVVVVVPSSGPFSLPDIITN